MSVFSSLQTLAEKAEKDRLRAQAGEIGWYRAGESRPVFVEELEAAWPLLEAAVKALPGLLEIAEIAMPDSYFETDSRVRAGQAALSSLTGEPR